MDPVISLLAVLIAFVAVCSWLDHAACWLIQHYRAHRRQHSVGNHTNQ